MTTKTQLLKDLNYCKESLEKLIAYAKRQEDCYKSVTHYTTIANDIIKLRRELNEIRVQLNPYEQEDE